MQSKNEGFFCLNITHDLYHLCWIVCDYKGQQIPIGMTKPAGDDCNTCTCRPNGRLECTEKICCKYCFHIKVSYFSCMSNHTSMKDITIKYRIIFFNHICASFQFFFQTFISKFNKNRVWKTEFFTRLDRKNISCSFWSWCFLHFFF